ncbi:MAG TPA: AMP-binding protein [Acidimicrobiales bacterium]|nr:AMP-binding protein [Acidimicrobiales bacterium]
MDTVAHHLVARAGDPRPGLLAGDDAWTWAEVVEAGAARAGWLAEARAPGPFHVAVLLDNVPDFCFWLGATALAGAVVVGANPTHRGPDLARDLAHTRCQLLVTDRAHLPLVEGLDLGPSLGTAGVGNPRVVVVDDPARAPVLSSFAGPARAAEDVTAESLGYLVFTSGTSGAPKACRCTQGRLARIGAIVAQMYELVPDDVCYVAMPLFHSNALMAGWGPALAAGATVALPTGGRFSASGFLPDVRRHGVTYFNYVGKPLSYILATPTRPDDADNTLRRVFGNEGTEADVARFAERFGCRVVDSYGSTEGGATVQRTPDTPSGALGRAPEGTMVVDPATGEECAFARFDAEGRLTNAEEAVGELVSATGGAGFEGYWDNEPAEAARLRNGWYWTGDLAYRDERGFFYFAGRADDWLRVDGENFAAAPVARVLERHPDVVLATVYAVPDPVAGDQVMAALELRPGVAFDPDAFAAFLSAQPDMGTKWVPRFLRVSAQLPTTATAKVLTRALRAESWHGTDPVYWSPDRARLSYRRLEPDDVTRLDEALSPRSAVVPP